MIDYGQEPSRQSELPLFGTNGGAELMAHAHAWIDEHPDEWARYKELALEECGGGSKASPNFVLQMTRRTCRVSIPNVLAPALARIATKQDPRLKFRLARSKADGLS